MVWEDLSSTCQLDVCTVCMYTSSRTLFAYSQQPSCRNNSSPFLHVDRWLPPHYLPFPHSLPFLTATLFWGRWGNLCEKFGLCIPVRKVLCLLLTYCVINCWLPAQSEITDTIVCINAETPVSKRGPACPRVHN